MPRLLIVAGILLIALGGLWYIADALGFKLGKLPGDLTVQGERYALHVPIVTCIVVSVLLSFGMWLFKRFL